MRETYNPKFTARPPSGLVVGVGFFPQRKKIF